MIATISNGFTETLSPLVSRGVRERFDLGGGFESAVGDDLFQHSDARFKLRVRSRILRGLFGGQVGFQLQLAFP